MDEAATVVRDERLAGLSGAQLLELAVERLLAEVPVELPEQVALDRARTVLACTERLAAVRLGAVADVDRRELFALDCAGSTRGWLRVQPGGEAGQLTAARRLGQRPLVEQALADGRMSQRAAEQVCAVLDKVPSQLEEPVVQAVLVDGIGDQLRTFTGGLVPEGARTEVLLADRREAEEVLDAAAADRFSGPAERLEPALVLLASRLTASHLGPALRELLEALLPDGADGVDRDPYFFELRELLDGDVDVRGHLSPEVGHGLAAEVARRVRRAEAAAKRAGRTPDEDDPGAEDATGADDRTHDDRTQDDSAGAMDVAKRDPLAAWDAALAAAAERPADEPVELVRDPRRLASLGRRRHDALGQLLHDLSDSTPGTGQPRAHSLTIVTTLDALEGRLGALPAQLATTGGSATLTTAQLQRMACSSDLHAVLLDALGNPVGASSTRRNLNRRERSALRAQWGRTCAVLGCPNTVTVPHHVEPFHLSRRTRLRDIVPACEHCHHDLHDGHRTLRLRDGRLIDEHGWVTATSAAA